MSTTTRIQRKGQVTIPTRVREQAGLGKGDLVEFSYQRGKIVITPKVVIDRSKFPSADDEYIRRGRVYGPFETHEEFVAALHQQATKPARKKTKRPAR